MQFYNACVMSTLLYGAECWTLKDKYENRLHVFDMRCQRKILKIRWSQYVRNINIRKKTNQPNCPTSSMVWASAAYGCDSITTKAVPMDFLPWTKKTRQTQDNLDRRHQTWPGLPYDKVDSGRGRGSCERPRDLGAFSTSGSRCIEVRCYLMMMMMMMMMISITHHKDWGWIWYFHLLVIRDTVVWAYYLITPFF